MKKLAIISAVVFTIITLQSCREADDVMSPDEAATLHRVQDSSNNSRERSNLNTLNIDNNTTNSVIEWDVVDGEIVPPPRK